MNIIEVLTGRDNTAAYQLMLKLEKESDDSELYYEHLNDFIGMLNSKSSYIRVRGFRLACAQAQWDSEGIIDRNFDEMLAMLDDVKPIAVRQYLQALKKTAKSKPYLRKKIIKKLNGMDLSKYNDSMQPLIQKDIDELTAFIID